MQEFEEFFEKIGKGMPEYAELEKKIGKGMLECGLNDDTPAENIKLEHLTKLAGIIGITLEQLTQLYIESAVDEREGGGISHCGKYNTPEMRDLDILISKLGYAFDASTGTYVRMDQSQIVIPPLSEKGEQVIKRWQEEAVIRNSHTLSQVDLIKQVFSYNLVLPKALVTNINARVDEVKKTLVHYLSTAKEIRLLGFDYLIDASPKIQEAYRQAVKNGAKISIIYHPKINTIKLEHEQEAQSKFDSFIDMLTKNENPSLCPLQPISETVYGAVFSNGLYWAIKAIDEKLLIVTHHFYSNEHGSVREIMENPNGIPGIKEGYNAVFDSFFGGNPLYELRPKGGHIELSTGDGHTYIVDYK